MLDREDAFEQFSPRWVEGGVYATAPAARLYPVQAAADVEEEQAISTPPRDPTPISCCARAWPGHDTSSPYTDLLTSVPLSLPHPRAFNWLPSIANSSLLPAIESER